jgi:hypothetical protein
MFYPGCSIYAMICSLIPYCHYVVLFGNNSITVLFYDIHRHLS